MPKLTKHEKFVQYSYLSLCLLTICAHIYLKGNADQAISSMIGLGIFYYCAIERPGTILISLTVFCNIVELCKTGFSFITSLTNPIYYNLSLFKSEPYLFYILIESIVPVITIVFLIFHLKLRKININRQEREVEELFRNNPELLSSWNNSSTLEDLAALFLQSVKQFPKYEKWLRREYNKRKKQLIVKL